VEHEVLAAAAAEKPIAFLISESSGTLPNTADKRYPVFRLETTIREQAKVHWDEDERLFGWVRHDAEVMQGAKASGQMLSKLEPGR
jgi:hypothetical protein